MENSGALRAVQTEFRKRRARQWGIAALFLTGIVLLGVCRFAAQEGASVVWGIPLSRLLAAVFVLEGISIPLALWNWRCPACRTHLGRAMYPLRCPACGVELHNDARKAETYQRVEAASAAVTMGLSRFTDVLHIFFLLLAGLLGGAMTGVWLAGKLLPSPTPGHYNGFWACTLGGALIGTIVAVCIIRRNYFGKSRR